MSYKILDERDIDLKYSSNSEKAQSGKAVAEAIKEIDKVYIGTDTMPEGYNIQINPEGSAFELPVTDQTYNPESENPQSGKAVAEATSFNLLYSTEITQEAFDEAGEDGIILITLGDSSIDLTPYNEILVHITVPDSSAINTEANMLYMYVTSNSNYSAGDVNVWLRPQSLGIAKNCQLNTTYNKFAISGFWHNDSFLYGIIARNGYRGSLGYASGVDGWTTVADNVFKKSEKHYFHIFGDEKTFKFPVGTKVIVYGR